jgi:hypothetical protein
MNPLLRKPNPLLIAILLMLAFGWVVRCSRHAGKVESANNPATRSL